MNFATLSRFFSKRFSGLRLGLAVAALAAVALTGACGHHRGGEAMSKFVTHRVESELQLTAPQKTELEALRVKVLAHLRDRGGDRLGMQQEISAQLRSDKVNLEAVKKRIHERNLKDEEVEGRIAEDIAAWVATLTPEQKKKLADLNDRMAEKMRHHHP